MDALNLSNGSTHNQDNTVVNDSEEEKKEKEQKERTKKLNDIYNAIFEDRNEDDAAFDDNETRKMFGVLEVDLRDERSQELIKKINESFELLPNLRMLSLRYVKEDDEDIRHFLTNAIDNVQSFFFNNHVLPAYRIEKIDIGNYMESIINILPKVTKDVYLYYMKINGKQLASIIK
jgi:hypothetical protein